MLCAASAHAAIAFRAKSTGATCGSCTSLAANLPTGTNHFIVLILSINNVSTGACQSSIVCTGYTSIVSECNTTPGTRFQTVAAFYRQATGSDATTCSFTHGDWVMLTTADYTGVAASSPIDSTTGTTVTDQILGSNCVNGTQCFSSLTPTGTGEMLILSDGNSTATSNSITHCVNSGTNCNFTPTAEWTNTSTGIASDEWDLALSTAAATEQYGCSLALPGLNFLLCPTGGCLSSPAPEGSQIMIPVE